MCVRINRRYCSDRWGFIYREVSINFLIKSEQTSYHFGYFSHAYFSPAAMAKLTPRPTKLIWWLYMTIPARLLVSLLFALVLLPLYLLLFLLRSLRRSCKQPLSESWRSSTLSSSLRTSLLRTSLLRASELRREGLHCERSSKPRSQPALQTVVDRHDATSLSARKRRQLGRQASHVHPGQRGYLMTMAQLIGPANRREWRGQFRELVICSTREKLEERHLVRLWMLIWVSGKY